MIQKRFSKFHLGVRQKMILVLLTVLTLAMTSTTWLTMRDSAQNVLRETQKRGEDIASFLSQAVAFGVVGYDYHTIQMLLDKIVHSQDVVFAKVLNRKGNPMAQAGSDAGEWAHVIRFTEPVVFDGETIGQVILGLDNRRIIGQLEAQRSQFILRDVAIIALIAIGEFLALSFIIVRPVSIISRSLQAQGDHPGGEVQAIPLKTGDEFGLLAAQFNDIRAQLISANERLQSKVDLADEKLRDTNEQLTRQSDELQRMNDQLKRLSITDPLTGLYNRRQYEELMNTDVLLSIRHGDANSLLVIDIDHFKKINDTYGHKSGDRVLRRLSDLLVENVRRSDMVCRVGGEEFVVCLKRAASEYAMLVAEKLRKKIQESVFNIGADRIQVTVSIGVASIPTQDEIRTAEELFERADRALYHSKQNGRNRVSHCDELNKPSVLQHIS